ncbi:MAG: cardiolipin synthase [Clostridiales bacterium]|nr:cardiolipin synthase [Clostridiales bacterium]
MKQVQRKTERRISAALRLVLVALLLLLQITIVVALTQVLRQKAYIAYAVLEIVSVFCVARIYIRPGSSSYKPGWIVLIMLVPVVGLILYFLWNGNQVKKKLALKTMRMPPELPEVQESSDRAQAELARRWPRWAKLTEYLRRQDLPLFANTEMTYFPTGEEYLEDLLARLEKAKKFIFLEYYIASKGQIWDRICKVLAERAADGVEVNLILDDFGSMMTMPPEEIQALRQKGIWVQMFNPVHHYVNRLYFNYRDHRKIAVIDGDVAYTGGANLADEYANLIVRFGYWKDCGLRLEGEGAWGFTRQFMYLWLRIGGELREPWDTYRPCGGVGGGDFCQPLVDGPDNNPVNTVEDTYQQLIGSANRYVWITTPYLAIDEPMIHTLSIAADSGVDVRLMLPGIPDHKFAYMVAQSYFGELLEHDVKIYTYTPGLLHAKSVVADGEVGFVGSVNMDYRSFQLHFECGALFSGSAVAAVQEDMNRTMEKSRQVTMEIWKKRKWYVKILGAVLRPFAMWM